MEYPGAIYHVLSRGNRRHAIFKDNRDCQLFLSTLAETCQKTEWQVHAYCLMPDHFHLVIETPQANLVTGMKWFLGVYSIRFNLRHHSRGHLFSGRYKSLYVDGGDAGCLLKVCDYVHLNPARAKAITPKARLESFVWSSYPAYLKPPRERPHWLRVDRLLTERGIAGDGAAGRKEFARQTEHRRREETKEDYASVRRGWFLGSQKFRRDLLALEQSQARASHLDAGSEETGQKKAQRIVREELQRRGWKEKDLRSLPKGEKHKVALAQKLRRETTASVKWIAQRLHMGSWTYVSNLVHKKID
jgi:REP element-mobilizing transposase RayT